MQLSSRNQLKTTVVEVKLGGIMAEIIMRLEGGGELVAAITRSSAERLNLAPGAEVIALTRPPRLWSHVTERGPDAS